MRTIKFRAWSTQRGEGKMLYLFPNDTSFSGDDLVETENWKVMQFTGLLDKNGKEIYESDIVYLAGYGNYQVEFPFIQLYESSSESDIGEIKGNVYENPELIKKK